MNDGLQLLREPFKPHQISKLPKGGVMLDYVGHAALTDRLLDADQNWNWEPLKYGEDGLPALDTIGGLWIKLTVCGVTRLGYGDAGEKKGPSAMKERIGDALRNAAMRFGAALDLWHKGDLHVEEPKDPANIVQNLVAANIKPASGVMESLEEGGQIKAQLVASLTKGHAAKGEWEKAYESWGSADLDADQKVASWNLLPSWVRSRLKQMKLDKEAAAKEFVAEFNSADKFNDAASPG